jgi:hypothetical protein
MSDKEQPNPTTHDVEGRAIPDAELNERADDTEGHAAKVRLGYAEQDETADDTEGHGRYYRLPDRERD